MRGVAQGEENIRRLRAYLVSLRAEQGGLPGRDGKPNLSVIAEACGFDRGVFYNNQAAKLLLDEAIADVGLETGRPLPENAFEAARIRKEDKARSDKYGKALEEEVLSLRAENARLREEIGRMQALRALMAETGRMP